MGLLCSFQLHLQSELFYVLIKKTKNKNQFIRILINLHHCYGSECWTGHEPAAHHRREGGVHAAEAGEDVGSGRRWGRVRVWGRQTRGESLRRPAEHGRAPGEPEVRPVRVCWYLLCVFSFGVNTALLQRLHSDQTCWLSLLLSYLWEEAAHLCRLKSYRHLTCSVRQVEFTWCVSAAALQDASFKSNFICNSVEDS